MQRSNDSTPMMEQDRRAGQAAPPALPDEAEGVPHAARRQRGTTLHHQIALVITDRIMSGAYQPGEALPGEPELCRQFQVSRITVRTALATLEQQGLVRRKQGTGTFVEHPKSLAVLRAPMSEVLAHIEEIGHRTQVQLLEFGLQRPPHHVSDFFEVPPDHILHRAVRLRIHGGKPFFHVETYVPDWIGTQIRRQDLEHRPFIDVLRQLGVGFASGEQTISATLASPLVAARLVTDVGAPLLQVRRFHRDARGRPVQYIEFLSSPTVFELRMTLGGDELPGRAAPAAP